jgi:hypothetical protein
MRKIIALALLAFITIGSIGTVRASDPPKTEQATTQKAERPQCKAITKKGTQCKHKAAEGSLYCKQHAGYQPKQ